MKAKRWPSLHLCLPTYHTCFLRVLRRWARGGISSGSSCTMHSLHAFHSPCSAWNSLCVLSLACNGNGREHVGRIHFRRWRKEFSLLLPMALFVCLHITNCHAGRSPKHSRARADLSRRNKTSGLLRICKILGVEMCSLTL